MFGDRMSSEEIGTEREETEAERGSGRRRRPLALLLVAIVGALLLVLGARRRKQPTLEPPF